MSTGSVSALRTASLLGLAVFGLLLLSGWYSPPLAHALAGLAGALLAFASFSLAWNLRGTLSDGSLPFLGVAFAFVAALDLLPLFSYPEFGLFAGFDGGLAERSWIAARMLQGASLLAAPFFAARPAPAGRTIAVYGMISAALAAAVFSGIVPLVPTLVEGVDPLRFAGHAAFGVLLALALLAFVLARAAFERGVLRLLLLSIAAALVSEAVLAGVTLAWFPELPYGFAALPYTALSGAAKALAFWFVYQALVRAGLARPGGFQARRLVDSEEKYRSLMDYAGDAILLADESGKLLEANRRAEELLGYTRQELQELTVEQIHPQSQRARVMAAFESISRQGQGSLVDTSVLTKDGRLVPVDISGAAVFYGGKKVIQGILRDTTDRKKTEERLRFLSTRDPLTGLYNRALYDVEFTRLERGRRFPVSIVVAHVDGLKEINSRLGTVSGDRLLRQAAQVFRESFRAEDIVARTGGDEFGVLLPHADMAAAAACLQRVRARVTAYSAAHPKAPLELSLGMGTARNGAEMVQAVRDADEDLMDDKRVRRASRPNLADSGPDAGAPESAADPAPAGE